MHVDTKNADQLEINKKIDYLDMSRMQTRFESTRVDYSITKKKVARKNILANEIFLFCWAILL